MVRRFIFTRSDACQAAVAIAPDTVWLVMLALPFIFKFGDLP